MLDVILGGQLKLGYLIYDFWRGVSGNQETPLNLPLNANTPGELPQQIPAPWAKARMNKPKGGGKFLVQIPRGAWGDGYDRN